MKHLGKQAFLLLLLFGVTSIATAQIQLTFPTVSGKPGTENTFAVLVSDLTGLGVEGFQLNMQYNTDLIEISDPLNPTGTLAPGVTYGPGSAVAKTQLLYVSTPNKMVGAGVIFKLKVKFKQLGQTTLTLDPTYPNKFTTGSASVPFTVVDGTLTVANVNTPATFDAIPAKTINENQELKFTVNAIDADSDPITYSAQGMPTGATFNTTTKEFSWKPTYSQAGNYSVTFTAHDTHSPSTISVSITVVDVNSAPVLNAIPDKSVNEGTELVIDVSATDAEEDNLVYSATGLPTGALFDAATRKFIWKPSSTQAGDYTVTFSVSDGKLSASTSVKITVVDANTAPTITPIADKTVNTNQQLTFDIVAIDGEGDNLIYMAGPLPSGATFDQSLHRFSWKPSGSQAGDYTVTFFVSDGNSTPSIIVKIKVIKVNSAPVFVKSMPDTTIDVHNVQVLFKYQYKASDADGDVVTFRLDGGPTGAIMSSSGLFSWIPKTTDAGQQFLLMITITDGTLSETIVTSLTTRSQIVGIEGDEYNIPSKYSMDQNYPNPFNPTTNIKFSLPKEDNVTLKVYNVMGEEVASLVNRFMNAGVYTVSFDAKNLSSGLYFYKIQTSAFSKTMKMLFAK